MLTAKAGSEVAGDGRSGGTKEREDAGALGVETGGERLRAELTAEETAVGWEESGAVEESRGWWRGGGAGHLLAWNFGVCGS